MLAYLVRRVLYAVLALWAVSVLSFFIIQLPAGDYVNAYIASLESLGEGGLPNDAADAIRETYGIDRPLPVQYFKWITRILFDFDFGISFQSSAPVSEIIGPRLLLTVVLALATVVFTWIIAIPIGIISAVKQYSVLDYVVTFLGFLGLAVPDFLLALVLLYVAFAWFDFSVGGLFSPEYVTAPWTLARIGDLGLHMIIPMIVLGTSGNSGDHSHCPGKSPGRVAQAVRRRGASQRRSRVEADSQVPGANCNESGDQPDRLHSPVPDLGKHHRLGSAGPAYDGAGATAVSTCAGHVPGGLYHLARRGDDDHRDVTFRHSSRLGGPARSIRGTVAVGITY